MDVRRKARLGGLFHREIADIVENRMGDPRLKLLTVTSVTVSADLGVASVYVTQLGGQDAMISALEALSQATPYIRGELAKRVRYLRQIPALRFYEDESVGTGARVDQLIQQWHEETPDPGND